MGCLDWSKEHLTLLIRHQAMDSDTEYRRKRRANTEAVRRYREKEKEREHKEKEENLARQQRMSQLEEENNRLRGSIQELRKGVGFMEEVFRLHGIKSDQWSHFTGTSKDGG